MSRSRPSLRPSCSEVALRSGVLIYVMALVAVPLLGLVHFGLADGIGVFWEHITDPIASAALRLTLWTAGLVGVTNIVLGTATAWVLVRYQLPGRGILSALVDLPLAIPTLVAGVMLVVLYGPNSLLGNCLKLWDLEIIFAPSGIVLALLFVTLPFVVRAVEPVLAELDPAEEEAAIVLGAGPIRTFRAVFLPAILPAALSGGIRSLGRALGEFGSMVVIAGNIPFKTLTAPVYIFGEIESGTPRVAAAVSIVLLLIALSLHVGARFIEHHTGARHATG